MSDIADRDLFRALSGASPEETQRIRALLVAHNSGLVGWLASRYAGLGVDLEELRQVAYVGLMLAIGRFDPDRGSPFVAFARPTVQGELQRHFRDRRRWIRLPRRLQETKAAIALAREELVHSLGRWPTTSELAGFLALEEEAVREAMAADETFAVRSLDEPVGGEGEAFADLLGGPDPRIELVLDSHLLCGLLADLPARDREIVQLRFFDDRTQSQIGAQLGISQMHVSRLLKSTLNRLRLQLDTVD